MHTHIHTLSHSLKQQQILDTTLRERERERDREESTESDICNSRYTHILGTAPSLGVGHDMHVTYVAKPHTLHRISIIWHAQLVRTCSYCDSFLSMVPCARMHKFGGINYRCSICFSFGMSILCCGYDQAQASAIMAKLLVWSCLGTYIRHTCVFTGCFP